MNGKTGVMVCGHGSRDATAVQEFEAVAEGLFVQKFGKGLK